MRSSLVVISALAGLSAIGFAQGNTAAATTYNVTASGFSAYVIDGVNNPTLTLTRGQTYTFTVDAPGHPFWITTARGAGDTETNAFFQGVTGNGLSQGTLSFVVPASAPATLFYQCQFHDPMAGTFNIVAPPGVPSGGLVTLAVLAGALLLFAIGMLRKRDLF